MADYARSDASGKLTMGNNFDVFSCGTATLVPPYDRPEVWRIMHGPMLLEN